MPGACFMPGASNRVTTGSKAHKIFDLRSIFKVRGQGQRKKHMCSDLKLSVPEDGRLHETGKNGWETTEANLRNQMMCLKFEVKVKIMLKINLKLCTSSYILYSNFQKVINYSEAY